MVYDLKHIVYKSLKIILEKLSILSWNDPLLLRVLGSKASALQRLTVADLFASQNLGVEGDLLLLLLVRLPLRFRPLWRPIYQRSP
jgi:hypothetical protein